MEGVLVRKDRKDMHQIKFSGVSGGWHNALPAGNGRMGIMVFQEEHTIHLALNQYDCYYQAAANRAGAGFDDPARFETTYAKLCRMVDKARQSDDYERAHYLRILHPDDRPDRPSYQSTSYPMGGEIVLVLADDVDLSGACLSLQIEAGRICFSAGQGRRTVSGEFFVAADEDAAFIRLCQGEPGLWQSACLTIPSEIGLQNYPVEFASTAERLVMRTGLSALHPALGMVQETAVYLPGSCLAGDATLQFPKDVPVLTLTAVLRPGKNQAAEQAVKLAAGFAARSRVHQQSWQQFWHSTVSLPDPLLETLWHLHVYLMKCAYNTKALEGNENSLRQACGLNGLWDIRRPNLWGSMWYWDANIQSAFWGSASAGHPELLKVFCDGYLAHEADIRAYTRQVYGVEGWALDYPHPLYHSIQPWCAQFLWEYYQYTGDVDFLANRAYPVFTGQIRFFKHLAKRDEQGIYHMDYDISPEQGPVTRDSVITVSSLRKLFKAALEAAGILGRPGKEQEQIKELLDHLPAYQATGDGCRWKDSPAVHDDLFLRHPSLLMPIFPAGEISRRTPPELLGRWENTLSWAAEHTEIGTFGSGWVAAAAAALGKGHTALRVLYEKALDLFMHSNGLCYEESERFINYCHITKPAHYLPAMCEASGGIVAAINLMLVQSHEEGIEVFPALPGEPDGKMEKIVQYREDDRAAEGDYPPWRDAGFEGLMVPGGFLVSAWQRAGKTVCIRVESTRDEQLKLLVPAGLRGPGQAACLNTVMKKGETLVLGVKPDPQSPPAVGPLIHTAARTNRRIFLGEDSRTAFYKAIDAITGAYSLGNLIQYQMTPVILDIGCEDLVKDYDDVYPRQKFLAKSALLHAGGPKQIGCQIYRPGTGYGFAGLSGLRAADRGGPDGLRRDFVQSHEAAEFFLHLPGGKYNLLIISGDLQEPSQTHLELVQSGIRIFGKVLRAGQFQYQLVPVVHHRDGRLSIRLSTAAGGCWKLNGIFVGKEYALL